jgi:hypothetical protein
MDMGLFRRSRILAAAMTSALFLSAIALVATQVTAGQRSDPDAGFRATLTEFYAEFEVAYAPFARIGPAGAMDLAAAGRRSVPGMTKQEIAALRDAFPASFWRNWKTRVMPALHRIHGVAPALEGGLLSSIDPNDLSANLMGHSCPQLFLGQVNVSAMRFTEDLLIAQAAELAAQIAYDAASNDPTGVGGAAAAVALGIAMTTRFVLEETQARVDACEDDDHKKIVHDKVDDKVSSRASQTSVDDLKNMITGMLDDLKRHVDRRAGELSTTINSRADRQESLTNARADRQEALTNRRSDLIEDLVNKRSDYADAIQKEVVAHQELALQVVEIERGRLLLVASERGTTVNVKLTSVRVAEVKPNAPVNFQEVLATTQWRQNAAGGVLEITLDLRGPAKDATVYVISVAHGHGSIAPIGPVTHTGTTIVRRNTP